MGYYDAINAMRGIAEQKRQRKEDRWSKLKDVAGLGMDVWKKLSYVPDQKKIMDYELELENKQYDPNSPRSLAEKRKLDMELQFNKDWLDYQNANPGKPSDQLFAEWKLTPEGQKAQEDALLWSTKESEMQHRLRMAEINASKSAGLSESGWTTYNNAVEQARNNFYQLDEANNVILKKGVTAEMVKEFLYAFAAKPFADDADAPGLKFAFDKWIQNPDFPQAGAQTPKPETGLNGKPISQALSAYKTEQLAKYDVVGGLNKAKELIASIKTPKIFGKNVVVDPTGISEKAEFELAMIANKMADDPEAQIIANELAKKGTPAYQRLQQIAQTLERLWKAKTAPVSSPTGSMRSYTN